MDNSDIDLHDYLDLANIESIQPKTRGQKMRQRAAEAELANTYLAEVQSSMPNTRGRKLRQKVPNNKTIDIDKIVKDDMPSYTIRQDLKVALHSRKLATKADRNPKENKKLQTEKARQLQIEKDFKEKEAKRRALEKAKISVLIEKHRPRIQNTPKEANILGVGKDAYRNDKEGTEKEKPIYKKATKESQIKSSHNKGTKLNKGMSDALLGDPIANAKKNTKKVKAAGRTDKIDENDV